MKNEFYFQFFVTPEQLEYASKLVDYSIQHHPVSDIFHNDPDGKSRQREFRFTGTLEEVVFADAYQLERPSKSFGAIDGQDFGKDFMLNIGGKDYSFDIKTMGRKYNTFRENYVLNLPNYQMIRENVVTDYYFCISLHKNENNLTVASFIGYVSKKEVMNGSVGILYKAGTTRIKDDGNRFMFMRDTYEVDFKDITAPFITPRIKELDGFRIKNILPPYRINQ